jgi:hypothetical protein
MAGLLAAMAVTAAAQMGWSPWDCTCMFMYTCTHAAMTRAVCRRYMMYTTAQQWVSGLQGVVNRLCRLVSSSLLVVAPPS